MPRFVVQEHYATRHHFDLSLERDGACSRGPRPRARPADPKKNRLAIRVVNHALSHLDREDPTLVRNEGAVRVRIWDQGIYEAETFSDKEIVVTFHGERLKGKYAIFITRDGDWLVHRVV